jgi:hypothetical protein
MLTALILLQAAAAQPAPDIQLRIDAHIDRVRIERRGEARLEVTAGPDAGSVVRVEAPQANGRRTLRNVDVHIEAEARIADPNAPASQNPAVQNPAAPETPNPQ